MQNNIQQESLANAVNGQSTMNYGAIFSEFSAKGIDDIQPRVNVFTFNAWKALGRVVRKGEHGVKVFTWISMSKKDEDTGEVTPIGKKPKTTTVFHVSQTDAIDGEKHQSAPIEVKQAPAQRVNAAPDYYSTEFTPIAKG